MALSSQLVLTTWVRNSALYFDTGPRCWIVWRALSASICSFPYPNVLCNSLKNVDFVARTAWVVGFKLAHSGCSKKSSRWGRIYSYAGPRRYEVRNKSCFRWESNLSAWRLMYVKHCSLNVLTWLRCPENSAGEFTLNDPPPWLPAAPRVDPVVDISSR